MRSTLGRVALCAVVLMWGCGQSAEEKQAELQARVAQKLQRHSQPKWIRAVAELPRTATGKVQRFLLREALVKN